jgi:release factor glutamine methyltransferase
MQPGSARPAHGNESAETLDQALRFATARLAASSDTAYLDAEVLLLHVLDRNRAFLRTWPERPLTAAEAERFQALVERRAKGVPVAYLTGEREFWSRAFAVRPGVLIPRPETELLVERALEVAPASRPADILDLGTGAGVIAVTLAAERPLARVMATDLSAQALVIARENAVRHGVTNLRFALGHWFAAVPEGDRFDLIVSNPPYIAENDPHLLQGDLRFEPQLALSSGPAGLNALTTIAEGTRQRLKPGGQLLLEHGYDQADALRAILAELGYSGIIHYPDLQGHRRAIAALRL